MAGRISPTFRSYRAYRNYPHRTLGSDLGYMLMACLVGLLIIAVSLLFVERILERHDRENQENLTWSCSTQFVDSCTLTTKRAQADATKLQRSTPF